ncbi:MAG TPA: MBL fold metallo-hydrolase, partial [candidate division Zixibacteria bacterium]|nr:MBL fold metallo-hydrolase [candidate division Zixibacteria bacterium]
MIRCLIVNRLDVATRKDILSKESEALILFFRQIIDPLLSQHAYLIGCETSKEAILFEPERDIDRYFRLAEKNGYKIVGAAETHIHADYLSGLRQFAEAGEMVYVSDEGDQDWKYEWLTNSKYPHKFLHHGDSFQIGNIAFKVLHTPGHTPEHISFIVSDKNGGKEEPQGILTGDFVFVGDVGRPDLLESAAGIEGAAKNEAGKLYDSIQKFKQLSPELMVWPSHGAGSACGKSLGAAPMSTIEQELKFNRSIGSAREKQEFVDFILSGQPEPPYYFARMKKENKSGPAVLNSQNTPKKISPEELVKLSQKDNLVVIDGRDWIEFRQGHLKGALFAPLDKYFMMVTGSYIESGTEIALITDEDSVSQTVTALFRIGHDKVVAYSLWEEFSNYIQKSGQVEIIDEVTVSGLKQAQVSGDGHILDVRNVQELVETGQIESAQNIAFTRLLVQKDEIPNDDKIYVYCRSGNRS